jgi:hypothetical protein
VAALGSGTGHFFHFEVAFGRDAEKWPLARDDIIREIVLPDKTFDEEHHRLEGRLRGGGNSAERADEFPLPGDRRGKRLQAQQHGAES